VPNILAGAISVFRTDTLFRWKTNCFFLSRHKIMPKMVLSEFNGNIMFIERLCSDCRFIDFHCKPLANEWAQLGSHTLS
jgi:hypothetical protein